ncbi:MAG: hypothetical protein AAGB31_13455, partial [Bdellovibrio sp.]
MNKISDKTIKTLVKIFINTLTCGSLVWGAGAFAETAAEKALKDQSDAAKAKAAEDAITERRRAERTEDRCENAGKQYREAQNKLNEACRKAGWNVAKCAAEAKKCNEEYGAEDEDSEESTSNRNQSQDIISSIGSAFGVQTQQASYTNSKSANKCPQGNRRDYMERKDDLTKDIKKLENELAEITEDEAKLQKEYSEESQKITQELT